MAKNALKNVKIAKFLWKLRHQTLVGFRQLEVLSPHLVTLALATAKSF